VWDVQCFFTFSRHAPAQLLQKNQVSHDYVHTKQHLATFHDMFHGFHFRHSDFSPTNQPTNQTRYVSRYVCSLDMFHDILIGSSTSEGCNGCNSAFDQPVAVAGTRTVGCWWSCLIVSRGEAASRGRRLGHHLAVSIPGRDRRGSPNQCGLFGPCSLL